MPQPLNVDRRPVVILGGGGHGRVIAEILGQLPQFALRGVIDPRGATLPGLPCLGGDEVLPHLADQGITEVAVAVGSLGHLRVRHRICQQVEAQRLRLATIVSPQAYVAPSAQLGDGCQVLPMAVVNSAVQVGWGTMIYSGAVVEHDCRLGNSCLIAPRAAIAGAVEIGDCVQIGIGAVVKEGVRIASDTVIGAGAVVIRDIEKPGCYVGVPATLRAA